MQLRIVYNLIRKIKTNIRMNIEIFVFHKDLKGTTKERRSSVEYRFMGNLEESNRIKK